MPDASSRYVERQVGRVETASGIVRVQFRCGDESSNWLPVTPEKLAKIKAVLMEEE